MKRKKSAGSGKMKALVLKHVEKVVIALALLFFVLLVLKASKLGNDFDLQPDQLQTASAEAEQAIKVEKPKPEASVPPWKDISSDIRTPVPASPYGVPIDWMHRLFPGETLRGQPEVYPLEKLRAVAGFGGISTSAAGGLSGSGAPGTGEESMEMDSSGYGGYGAGGKAEGQRWVVLTGLLPFKKQFTEYGNVFRNAELQHPQLDVPSYSYYDVERAEVTPGLKPKEEDWKKVSVLAEFMERTKKWAGAGPPIINRKFLHSPQGVMPMAYPLPPVVNKSFGPEIAHEPEIPLHYEIERKPQKEEIDYRAIEDDPEALAKAKARGPQGGGYGGSYGGGSGMSEYDMEGSYEQDYGYDEYGSGSGYEMGSYGMGYGEGSGMAGRMMPRREIPQYQLFRFFDFTVQAGRYYQYRVRLKLANPNKDLPVQAVESEDLTKAAFLDTDWSDPSELVSVPLDSRILAGLASVSSNPTVPPKAQSATVYFNPENGEEVADKLDVVYRGQYMNYFDVTIEEEKPAANPYMDMYGSGESSYDETMGSEAMYGYGSGSGSGSRRDRGRKKDEEPPEKINFVTNMLVLDFDGGGSLPGPDRQLKAPSRILVMDPAGNLVMKTDLKDQEEWVGFFPPEVKQKKPELEPGMEEMMYGSGSYSE